MSRALERWLAPIRARLTGMVARAVVRSVNDAPRLQELELSVMGTRLAKAERFQTYGLTVHPFAGAEAVVVFAQGNPEHPLVVSVDDRRERPTGLVEGDVMLYASGGARVHLKANGDMVLHTDGQITVEADSATVTAAGAANVQAQTVAVEATALLELTVATSKITLAPGVVTIAGAAVNINQA